MHEFNIGLLVVALSALLLGLLSTPLKRVGLPDSCTLLLVGVVLGPTGLALLDPTQWGNEMVILEQVARLALAIGLMGIALRLPKRYVFDHWRSLCVLLLVSMPLMWLCSSLLTSWTLGLPLGAALLIGAVVTPTDPVVASTLVTGPVAKENLPAYLRHIISSESGANDGLTFIFVMLAVFLLTLPVDQSITLHMLGVLGGDILAALVLGAVLGYAVGFAMRKAEEKHTIDQPSMLMVTTALALTTLTAVKLVGSNGILAVFVAGLAFDLQVNAPEKQEEERVVEGVDRFFTSPIFLLLGLMIPWQAWLSLGWPALALTPGILLLRRLPFLLLIGGHIRDLPTKMDGSFTGWFGPVGVAALYYAALAHHKTDVAELWPVVSLLVVSSILVHGLTSMPFSHLYRRVTEATTPP